MFTLAKTIYFHENLIFFQASSPEISKELYIYIYMKTWSKKIGFLIEARDTVATGTDVRNIKS